MNTALPRAASIYFHSEMYAFSIACYRGRAGKAPIWNIWCKGRLQLYWTDICSSTKMWLSFCLCVRVCVCVIVGRPSCILSLSLSLSSFCWWTGLVTLEGEFCGSSFNILGGDSKCIFPLFHTEDLRLKTCLWAELQPWRLRSQWKTCPWAEHSDDILIIFGWFISLLKYWRAHPNKSATCIHWSQP